ncbi:MAG: hypothetical protein KDD47_17760 [Acidobacteria bacterium]|nr:hypothetical protein [Acidobacteriota bacterium]
MSGIAAVLAPQGREVSPEELGAMLAAQAHRGPEGSHAAFLGCGGLGHLHFRTTPEEAGEIQPQEGAGGRLLLSFDGRLDNRGELWRSLPTSPGPLSSLSDAALVLAGYEAWGTGTFARLLGPFAVAVLDGRKGTPELILARDPLGARPLTFSRGRDTFIAASEEMGVLAHPSVEAELCPERLAVFFAIQDLIDGKTFFRGVEQVLPGHGLRIRDGQVESFRFWAPDLRRRYPPKDDGELAEAFHGILAESVACRMRSPRTPAALLSGGLDSSPIVAQACRHLEVGERLETLTWVFDEYPESDERFYVEALARELPLRSHYLLCDPAWPLAGGEEWPVHPTTPEQNPYRLFHERAYHGARGQGARVVLSGMAGDQLYAGTGGFVLDLLRRGRLGAALAEFPVHLAAGRRRRLLKGLVPARWQLPRSVPPPWLTPEAARLLPEASPWPPDLRRARRPWQALQLLGLMNGHGFAVEAFYAGRAGVELRYPLRDRRLVELMLSVPTEQLYSRGTQRPILRRAMAGRLPESLLQRQRKATFAPLFFKGLLEEERNRVDDLLSDSAGLWPAFVRRDWLRNVREQKELKESAWVVLWCCISAEIWHRRHKNGIFASPPTERSVYRKELLCPSDPQSRSTAG